MLCKSVIYLEVDNICPKLYKYSNSVMMLVMMNYYEYYTQYFSIYAQFTFVETSSKSYHQIMTLLPFLDEITLNIALKDG